MVWNSGVLPLEHRTFVSLYWLHLHLVLLMLFLQLLVFSVNRKERANSVRALAAATQQRNCAAPEGKVWTCEILFVYSIPSTPVFQEAWQPNKPKKLTLKALHLDKAQDFSVKSRSLHILCPVNHAEGKMLFWMFGGNGNFKPAWSSLGHRNPEQRCDYNEVSWILQSLKQKPTFLCYCFSQVVSRMAWKS